MKKKETLEKVIADLEDLKNLIEFFATEEEIPLIEIDIVKRKLQDVYALFSGISKERAIHQSENSTEPSPKTKPIEEERTASFIVEKKETEEKKPEKQTTKTEKSTPQPPKSTLSDKLRGNNVSLNERLSNGKDSDLSSRLQKGPIKDLNEAIGLNDKFSYIKTLFHGDAHKFRETIDVLNSVQSISEAEDYISGNFDWNMEDQITQQFLNLIHRKILNSNNG